MGLFNFGKKVKTVQQKAAKADEKAALDLKSMLSKEEIRLLITDLNTVSGKVPNESKAVVMTIAEMIDVSGMIPEQGLSLCIAAVEDALGTFSAFGLAPAGHTALLEKLKKLKKEE